jgi:hypothetical protein
VAAHGRSPIPCSGVHERSEPARFDGRPTLFFEVPRGHPVGETITVTGPEAPHARTLRLRAGDGVALVDGTGGRWYGTVTTAGLVLLGAREASETAGEEEVDG